MPFVRIWIHLIWSTKNRERIIVPELRPLLLEHLKKNAKEKEIWIESVNCVSDHVHVLLSLGREQTISKIAMLLKGESSHWMNVQHLLRGKFEWQDEYIAVSISEPAVEKVKEYIKHQEEHHRQKTFAEEYDEVMKKYNVFQSSTAKAT